MRLKDFIAAHHEPMTRAQWNAKTHMLTIVALDGKVTEQYFHTELGAREFAAGRGVGYKEFTGGSPEGQAAYLRDL